MPRFYKWGGAFELDFATILANLTALISQITPHQMQTLKDSNQINPHEVRTLKGVVGGGERLRGEGSDFAIKAPSPLAEKATSDFKMKAESRRSEKAENAESPSLSLRDSANAESWQSTQSHEVPQNQHSKRVESKKSSLRDLTTTSRNPQNNDNPTQSQKDSTNPVFASEAKHSTNEADFTALKALLSSLPTPPKDGWERVRIRNIADVQSGGTPSKKIKEYWNGSINWLKSEVCQNCYVYESQVKEKITDLGLKKSSAKILKKGSVLIALVGATIGKIGYLTFESTTNQNIAGLYPLNQEALNNKFLYFACFGLYSKFRELGDFSMANLTFIRNLQIPLPPLKEQEKIISAIEYIENEMRDLAKILDILESQKSKILQKYL